MLKSIVIAGALMVSTSTVQALPYDNDDYISPSLGEIMALGLEHWNGYQQGYEQGLSDGLFQGYGNATGETPGPIVQPFDASPQLMGGTFNQFDGIGILPEDFAD